MSDFNGAGIVPSYNNVTGDINSNIRPFLTPCPATTNDSLWNNGFN